MNYAASLAFLVELEAGGIQLGLERIQSSLKMIGKPHEQFQSILVGGTNGKGSTAAFLCQILHENCYKVGLYTSPHLLRINERFQINGKPISNQIFAKQVTALKEKIEEKNLELSHFEFLTCLAFQWFAKKKVEIAVLEVGLGGRLDATNVIQPLASVITNIALEHEKVLGNSLHEIALEKAGIMRKGLPLITEETSPPIVQLFAELARGKQAPFLARNHDFSVNCTKSTFKKTVFSFKGLNTKLNNLETKLVGEHQAQNAGLAIATLLTLKQQKKIRLNVKSIQKGLKKTRWPGRFQVVQQKPLVIVDACHNPSGAQALAQTLQDTIGKQKIILVFGASTDKNAKQMLKQLVPFTKKLVLCQAQYRGTPTKELKQHARQLLPSFKIIEIFPVKKAVKQTLRNTAPTETVLIAGSIFMIGEALAALKKTKL